MDKVLLTSLDMYECQALHNELAKAYVRKGKCFIYIGERRFEVPALRKEDQWEDEDLSESVKTHSFDFSNDFTYEGRIYFNQNAQGWIMGITDPSNRSNPLVVLRLAPRPTVN
ncbi:hypothetical protein AH04_170 [Erwinia phage AH04]|uniref:Uncharacterized protein n=1 Tax=Erwinia phage AH04 TaxID=2869569 RepID=A0AAE7X0Z6_9CAUD|nr:hypothetical protein PQC02_gp144 [Erwinia phage AH04]QZA70645.1 hypothetical protein AH04_170 [Erwinia phage AH04]